ncbi:MAG: YraN family protein [Patescibacteria group bacterium]
MTLKSEIGQIGEDLACEYLINKNYRIVDRNLRKQWGEIDIIATDKQKTLVFVEVKTMRNNPSDLKPEDNLTSAKLIKLKRSASMFAGFNPQLIDDNIGWRIDLVTVFLPSKEIKHYENI